MPSWNQIRSSLFAHPKRSAVFIWSTSTIALIITTCVELIPLARNIPDAEGRRDDAQNAFDETLKEFNGINANIDEAEQRVIDLDCAMRGYKDFNQRVVAFQYRISNSSTTPIEGLQLFWKITRFVPDTKDTDQSVVGKKWIDHIYLCPSKPKCTTYDCCPRSKWEWVDTPHYYNEITTIKNTYEGIVEGNSFSLDNPLECNYYSRRFGAFAPLTYVTYESPHIPGGDRNAGTTYVNFNRNWGSLIPATYTLDENVVNFDALVLSRVDQNDQAADLWAKLNNFLAIAITAFNMVGDNYPALQISIRNQIPMLLDKAAAVNATLQEKGLVLSSEKVLFTEADSAYKNGELFWMLLLFFGPLVLGTLTYLLLTCCKEKFADEDAENNFGRGDDDDLEAQVKSQPSTYSPSYHQPSAKLIPDWDEERVDSSGNKLGHEVAQPLSSSSSAASVLAVYDGLPESVENAEQQIVPPPAYAPASQYSVSSLLQGMGHYARRIIGVIPSYLNPLAQDEVELQPPPYEASQANFNGPRGGPSAP
jgi:hypothetical protein